MATKIVIKGIPGLPVYSIMLLSLLVYLRKEQIPYDTEVLGERPGSGGFVEVVTTVGDDDVADAMLAKHPDFLFRESEIGKPYSREYLEKIINLSPDKYILVF